MSTYDALKFGKEYMHKRNIQLDSTVTHVLSFIIDNENINVPTVNKAKGKLYDQWLSPLINFFNIVFTFFTCYNFLSIYNQYYIRI